MTEVRFLTPEQLECVRRYQDQLIVLRTDPWPRLSLEEWSGLFNAAGIDPWSFEEIREDPSIPVGKLLIKFKYIYPEILMLIRCWAHVPIIFEVYVDEPHDHTDAT